MRSVLFVCTGNVFRSLTAEYALKRLLEGQRDVRVGSAGLEGGLHGVHPKVAEVLRTRGLDVSPHVPRPLTAELVRSEEIVVAMGVDHQRAIRESFGRSVPLFNELCFGSPEGVLDIHEAVGEWQARPDLALAHVVTVIDHIIGGMPHFWKGVSRAA